MKVALIHDGLPAYGGAEKVLEEIHSTFPSAPIFTTVYDRDKFPKKLREQWEIRTAWLDRFPFSSKLYRGAFPLIPRMFSTIDLREFDLVISSSYNFAHHVFTGPNTAHVCYCHSPSRFLWDFEDYAEKEGFGFFLRAFISSQLTELRALDRSAAQGVDRWVSTSRLVQNRIKKFYRRRSVILPPPINIDEFHISEKPEDYFLLLMRLVPWKRADIAIQACSKLGLPLVVAGDGRDYSRLKTIAGPSVRFVGRMDGQDKADLYSNCCAFIIPSIEDFGITPLEAMASGRPVIALGQGGALDTVLPGTTGEFFMSQSVESLVEILRSFDPSNYDSIAIREYAKSFDTLQFRDSMRHISAKALGERCVSKLVNQK